MRRPLTEEYAYLILDARYERVREAGVIRSRAVLVAIGIDWEGRRQVLAVELANRRERHRVARLPDWSQATRPGRRAPRCD